MKNLKKVLFSLLAATAMWSCSDDKIGPDAPDQLPEGQGEGFYMALDIQMPTGNMGSRSETTDDGTSTGGTEFGSDEENTVSSALIVLASKNAVGTFKEFGFIAASEVQSNYLTSASTSTSKEYKALARIQKTNLNSFYQALGDNNTVAPEVYVFVFCNPTNELREMFSAANTTIGDTEWINETCTVIQGSADKPNENIGIWGANSFLMNNVELTTRQLPAKVLDWEKFNTVDKPFHLSDVNTDVNVDNLASRGAVKVERSVARFDFKDGSNNNNTYNVLYYTKADGEADTNNPLVKVQLQKMALVNMSNSFYYLPRVSDNGQPDGPGFEICGKEKGWQRNPATGVYAQGNYVVDPYAEQYGGTTISGNFSDYFNFAFFNNNGTFANATMASSQWDVYKVSDVLNGRGDNYTGTDKVTDKDGNATHKPGDYHVWRYVTENAIPDGPAKQMNGISTGIVFKARMLGTTQAESVTWQSWDKDYVKNVARCLNGDKFSVIGVEGEHAPIKGNSTDDPILYYFNGHLYMTWPHIRQAAIQASVTINANGETEVNRSNSLYKAVFGEGPIPAQYVAKDGKVVKNQYIKENGEKIDVADSQWNPGSENWQQSAPYTNWTKSPDGKWTAWNYEGKPVPPTLGDEANAPATLTAMRQAVTAAGITIYQSSIDGDTPGYYCYYYYWNRHNDNGIPGVMGPMEFAVVRNNVYKLSVDKISRLGHPRIPGNDPDKPTPGTPDESDEIYLDVKVAIVPWAVRLNSIEF